MNDKKEVFSFPQSAVKLIMVGLMEALRILLFDFWNFKTEIKYSNEVQLKDIQTKYIPCFIKWLKMAESDCRTPTRNGLKQWGGSNLCP